MICSHFIDTCIFLQHTFHQFSSKKLQEPLKNQGVQKTVQPEEGTDYLCAHRSKRVHKMGIAVGKKRKLSEPENLQHN
jgi:hypothetical protein